MSVIYEPKGKAREYSELAVNLYDGCTHGCKYCFVPDMPVCRARGITRKQFHAERKPRKNILERLEKDAKKMKGCDKPLLLCFTCDPFCVGKDNSTTIKAVEILSVNGFENVQILTKGASEISNNTMAMMGFNGWKFAQSVVFTSEWLREKWEPNTTSLKYRELSCICADTFNCETWISIEPVVNIEEAKSVYYLYQNIADKFKIGKINHHPEFEDQHWKEFAEWCVRMIPPEKLYMKESLKQYLE